jgi:hypothetical protein
MGLNTYGVEREDVKLKNVELETFEPGIVPPNAFQLDVVQLDAF